MVDLDINTAFAYLAKEQNYCRPEISSKPILHIEKGRHPVVEKTLSRHNALGAFSPNDCFLDNRNRLNLLQHLICRKAPILDKML